MSKLQSWLYAFRLRTLPLAFSSIITGNAMAFADHRESFNTTVLMLCLITTLLLQILSNLANDYGDSEKGTDNEDRIGPKRAVQQGLLSFQEIKIGILITGLLSLLSGVWLIYEANKSLEIGYSIFFLFLGLAAIAAAIKYTVGKSAYGYQGLGDLFVLLFFGVVGVCGSYFLQTHNLNLATLLPAFTIGAFASGVLNLNNMRDHISDAKAGKNTLVVKIGLAKAKKYHTALIVAGFVAALIYVILVFSSTMQLFFILSVPLFRKHVATAKHIDEPRDFDPLLKQLALSTFLFSILFSIGVIVGSVG